MSIESLVPPSHLFHSCPDVTPLPPQNKKKTKKLLDHCADLKPSLCSCICCAQLRCWIHLHRNEFFLGRASRSFLSHLGARTDAKSKKQPQKEGQFLSIGPHDLRCLSWVQTKSKIPDARTVPPKRSVPLGRSTAIVRPVGFAPRKAVKTHQADPQNRSPGKGPITPLAHFELAANRLDNSNLTFSTACQSARHFRS